MNGAAHYALLRMHTYSTRHRNILIILAFLIQVCLANYLSFIIRYGTALPTAYSQSLSYLPILLFIRLVFYLKVGLYKDLWLYKSMSGQFNIIKSATFGSIIFYLIINYLMGSGYPRLAIVIDWFLFIMITGGGGLLVSVLNEYPVLKASRKKTLLEGTCETGQTREMEINSLREKDIAIPTIVLLFSVLIWSWWTIFFVPFNDDAGYYLSVAERINEGWKPYRDFHVHYPPVGLYYFALSRKIFGEGSHVYKFAFLLVELCSAVLVFLLSASVIKSKTLRLAGTLLFLLLYLAYDGNCFVLEYFVVVFSLITILLLTIRTKKRLFPSFFAGISFLFAVMSKQYGIAILPALIILLLRDPEGSWLNLKLGGMRIVVFLFSFFTAFHIMLSCLNVNVAQFMSQLSGSDYEKFGIAQMVSSIFSLKNIWLILILLLSSVIAIRKFQFNFFIILLLCVLSFSPLYVRTYPHYYQLILPYGVILLLGIVEYYYFLSKSLLKTKALETASLFFLCISLFFSISYSMKDTIYFTFHKEALQKQLTIAKRINMILPSGSPVLVINEPVYDYLCNFKPPVMKDGYVWLWFTSGNNDLEKYDFMKARNIVFFNSGRPAEEKFLVKLETTHDKITEFPITENTKVEIWKRTGILETNNLI